MESFAQCFQARRLTFPLPRCCAHHTQWQRLSSVVVHAAHDSAEACSAHPWCAGTCAACLSAVMHATHDGVACLSACMPRVMALGAQCASLVHRDMCCMPQRHRTCRARRGRVSVGAHAARNGAASQRASLGAQGRAPHARCTSLGCMDIRCMSAHVPAHQVACQGTSDVLGPQARLCAGWTCTARVGRGGWGHVEGVSRYGFLREI